MRNLVWLMPVSLFLVLCACGSPEQPPPTKPASPASGEPVAGSATVPEIITLDASEGKITLPHLAHARKFHCNTCHSEVNPGKIAWDMDTAHAYCRDCHMKHGKGPTTCATCHRK